MENITLTEIAKYTSGKQNGNGFFSNISINSKNIEDNCLFIGIKGKKFDGNDFLDEAIENGAKAVLTTRDIFNAPSVKVCDTNKALLDLACNYRKKFADLQIVAVSGSVGKTTTKEMMESVLSKNDKTHKTEGNLNNHIGVPLTLLGIKKNHKYAVIEMGMSNFKEIETLSKITMPNYAIITNIGVSHMEFLGSKEGILKAKLEIEENLSGPIILNGDDELLANAKTKNKAYYYGITGEKLDVTASDIKEYDSYTTFNVKGFAKEFMVKINTLGMHNVLNALSVITVALLMEIPKEQIINGLEEFQNAKMRQNIVKLSNYTVIDDTYNASTDSIIASLNILKNMNCKRKVLILAPMGELGKQKYDEHKKVLEYAEKICDKIYLYGDIFEEIKLPNFEYYKTKEELKNALKIKTGDVVLIKGSRAYKMEEVSKFLICEGK